MQRSFPSCSPFMRFHMLTFWSLHRALKPWCILHLVSSLTSNAMDTNCGGLFETFSLFVLMLFVYIVSCKPPKENKIIMNFMFVSNSIMDCGTVLNIIIRIVLYYQVPVPVLQYQYQAHCIIRNSASDEYVFVLGVGSQILAMDQIYQLVDVHLTRNFESSTQKKYCSCK